MGLKDIHGGVTVVIDGRFLNGVICVISVFLRFVDSPLGYVSAKVIYIAAPTRKSSKTSQGPLHIG